MLLGAHVKIPTLKGQPREQGACLGGLQPSHIQPVGSPYLAHQAGGVGRGEE